MRTSSVSCDVEAHEAAGAAEAGAAEAGEAADGAANAADGAAADAGSDTWSDASLGVEATDAVAASAGGAWMTVPLSLRHRPTP